MKASLRFGQSKTVPADGIRALISVLVDGSQEIEKEKKCFFGKNVAFLLVDQEICSTFAVALFGNESEKAV